MHVTKTLREIREGRGIRLEDMAEHMEIPINDLCDLEMASTRYAELLASYMDRD